MTSNAKENDNRHSIVISSRLRLARNFSDFPFPVKMNEADKESVLEKVKDVVLKSELHDTEKLFFVDMNGMKSVERQVLVERHLISPDFAMCSKGCGFIASKDERVSIMINEEDHLRIQCIFSGNRMNDAWTLCEKIDNIIEEKINYAFSYKFGYLTACPTNLGTGIRASAMLHLPALTMTGYIRNVLEACNKLGIAVRGIYGENSEALGNMFQVSNQVCLGHEEKEIISIIMNVINQITEQENALRSEIYKQNAISFEDRICRAYGIFKNARIMSSEESMKLMSDIRLGIDMGIIEDIGIEKLNKLMVNIQPGNLQKMFGKHLSLEERDTIRAENIRKELAST